MRHLCTATALAIVSISMIAGAETRPGHDYPTQARADYVVGCLAANGFGHEYLRQCSCEIDVIASELDYDDYDQANTVLGLQQNSALGRRGEMFRDNPKIQEELRKLWRAQADANLDCL